MTGKPKRIIVQVEKLPKSRATDPRTWDDLTKIASAKNDFVADAFLSSPQDFELYRRTLGGDLIYLHYRYRDGKFEVDKRCTVNAEFRPHWAGVITGSRSGAYQKFKGSTRLVQSFYYWCFNRLNELVAYTNGNIFSMRVLQGKTELVKCEMIYGRDELRRKVVEAMGDYQVPTEDIQGDSDAVAMFGKP